MADWREKLKTISSTKGDSAPEGAKRAGIGCLSLVIAVVSILTFIITIGLLFSGSWVIGTFAAIFCVISASTAVLLLLPQKAEEL
ncbi:MAG TPA: hypothetical protein VK947_01295 [Planococcus sp. (in: firmicutes)]|nr:hypothetical protein [Planococcus sp. (in: firmicutes)]